MVVGSVFTTKHATSTKVSKCELSYLRFLRDIQCFITVSCSHEPTFVNPNFVLFEAFVVNHSLECAVRFESSCDV